MNAQRRLHVVLAHEQFPPDFRGGGEYVVLETARHLQLRGHRITVVTTGDPAIAEYEGIRTLRLPMRRFRMNLAWREIAEAGRDADVIHGFTYHAAYPTYRAARALGKPAVYGVLALFGDVWRQMKGNVVGRAFAAVERRLLDLPHAARVYLSDESRELARAMGIDRSSDVVIEPGITLEDYAPAPEKDRVMFSGKLEPRKGVDVVFAAARLLPEIPFHIVGWGERFDEYARSAPSNVRMERFKDRRQLACALAIARIFVFPTRAETFGLVVAEAMASGCAIVSTLPIAFAGERIPPDHPAALARAVRYLWENPERCAAAGELNRKAAQRFSWTRHAEALELLYLRLVASRS